MTPATGPNPPAPPALSVSSTSSAPPRRGRALPVMFAIAVVVLAADTISTALALDKLAGHPTVRMLNGLITVHTTLNAGAAFGFGTSYTAVICLFGCGVVLAIIILAKRLRSRAWTIALGLLLGGAAANLGDRLFRAPGLFRGRVVDWINLPHVPWTFNPADASITCAAAMIAVLALCGVRLDGTSARAPADSHPPLPDRHPALSADRRPALADHGGPLTESDG
jgi:signal peptidase II